MEKHLCGLVGIRIGHASACNRNARKPSAASSQPKRHCRQPCGIRQTLSQQNLYALPHRIHVFLHGVVRLHSLLAIYPAKPLFAHAHAVQSLLRTQCNRHNGRLHARSPSLGQSESEGRRHCHIRKHAPLHGNPAFASTCLRCRGCVLHLYVLFRTTATRFQRKDIRCCRRKCRLRGSGIGKLRICDGSNRFAARRFGKHGVKQLSDALDRRIAVPCSLSSMPQTRKPFGKKALTTNKSVSLQRQKA